VQKASEKSRAKEAEHIKLHPLPSPQQYRSWRNNTRGEIAAASHKPEACFRWVLEAEAPTATYDLLADSGEFGTLDIKLAAALTKVATGELGRKITLAVETEAKRGRMVKGRQILWMVRDYHKYDEEIGALYDYQDLLSVRLKNDSQLESFMNSWDSVLAGMRVTPAEELLEVLFLAQLRHSQVLKEEIAHYDRSKKGSESRTYAFLLESVRRYLERQRLLRNRTAVSKGLGADGMALPAPSDKKQKKQKREKSADGKKEKRGRSPSPARSSDGKGVCVDFQKGHCKRGKDCRYSHDTQARGSSASNKGKGKGKSRSSSPGGGNTKDIPCRYFKLGSCKNGATCPYKHEAAAAPADRGRDTTPKAKKEKKAKKDKDSKGDGKSGSKSAVVCVVPAALCVSILKTSAANKPVRAVKQRLRDQKMTRYDYVFTRKSHFRNIRILRNLWILATCLCLCACVLPFHKCGVHRVSGVSAAHLPVCLRQPPAPQFAPELVPG